MMVKRGDILYADLNSVRGSEQGGTRPVLVIQNDVGNKHSPTTIIAPITSKLNKTKVPTHVPIHDGNLASDSVILLEQIRTLDKSRLLNDKPITQLSKEKLQEVDKAIRISLGIT